MVWVRVRVWARVRVRGRVRVRVRVSGDAASNPTTRTRCEP